MSPPVADVDSRSGALAPAPTGSDGPALPLPAHLKFFYGPMDCGKSTLALQIDHNHARQGRRGLLLTMHDRSGGPMITTRVGLARQAVEVGSDTDIRHLVRAEWSAGRRVDYVIVDEAGFLSAAHVDQLAELVDESHIDVYCFGLATDFRTLLLPGAKRLFELADEVIPVHVEVLCWCGRPGQLNARISHGRVVREGETVLVADTSSDAAEPDEPVHYQVLCRAHHRRGDLGPASEGRDQLTLPV